MRKVHGRTPLACERLLLDIPFTRRQLSQSVVFPSGKSSRDSLPKDKVDHLISKSVMITSICNDDELNLFFYFRSGCVQQRFPEFNVKELVQNLNI